MGKVAVILMFLCSPLFAAENPNKGSLGRDSINTSTFTGITQVQFEDGRTLMSTGVAMIDTLADSPPGGSSSDGFGNPRSTMPVLADFGIETTSLTVIQSSITFNGTGADSFTLVFASAPDTTAGKQYLIITKQSGGFYMIGSAATTGGSGAAGNIFPDLTVGSSMDSNGVVIPCTSPNSKTTDPWCINSIDIAGNLYIEDMFTRVAE